MGDLFDMADQSRRDPDCVSVGVGELAVATHPRWLLTPALGSCVGVALYDRVNRRGGLAHVMLPVPLESGIEGREMRFASAAIPALVRMLADEGTARRNLVAKIAGGAAMFGSDSGLAGVGDRNVGEVKHQLGLLGIPIIAEDTGERHARTVELRLDTGLFVVRSYQYGVLKL